MKGFHAQSLRTREGEGQIVAGESRRQAKHSPAHNGSLAGGLNGSSYLNPATVHDDGAPDTLSGSLSSLDWFFASSSNQDTVKNSRIGEVITLI